MDPRIGPEPEPLPRTKGQRFLEAIPFGLGVRNKPRHYPEANVLIPRRCDPVSGEPDYTVFVEVNKPEAGG